MNFRNWIRNIVVLAAVSLLLAILQVEMGWAWTGRAVGVADGDTITILRDRRDQVKIRLYGIDAPESGQPFGKAAKQSLSSMVYGQSVEVEVMDTDRYGRTVARVFVDGDDVNAAQLRSGYAWLYRQYCKDWVCGEWTELEATARSSRVGLWADQNPTPPWQWRRDKKAVFRAEDTDGQPLEYETIPLPKLPFMEVAEQWGIKVTSIPGGAGLYGSYNARARHIRLASPEEMVFLHELAHAAHDRIRPLKGGQRWD